jgi:hypothetical protein
VDVAVDSRVSVWIDCSQAGAVTGEWDGEEFSKRRPDRKVRGAGFDSHGEGLCKVDYSRKIGLLVELVCDFKACNAEKPTARVGFS